MFRFPELLCSIYDIYMDLLDSISQMVPTRIHFIGSKPDHFVKLHFYYVTGFKVIPVADRVRGSGILY